MIVITKIIELRQEDIKACIAESTNQKLKDYDDFANKLDEKFK